MKPESPVQSHHRARANLQRAGALLVIGLFGSWSNTGHAQVDINPPKPNVLLLVDTSGSMEYKLGSTSFPSCTPGSASPASEKSRWIELVETLTGTIPNYRCQSVDRTAASFATSRYGTGGPLAITPYDYLYENPYHRPLSGTCAVYPSAVHASNAYAYPSNYGLGYHPYTTTASNCTFPDATDGILDSFSQAVRFGLMTFDTQSNAGTGITGTVTPNHTTGIAGTWSYVRSSTTAIKGAPQGCALEDFEVGARNGAAPVWEGRMVPFGVPDSGSTDYLTKKAQIEKVLLATRPYGATPIAGMMEDAHEFLLNEAADDPVTAGQKLGPKDDPYVVGGCRKQFIILLSDGQPNMDLRAPLGQSASLYCTDASPKTCPFRKAEDVATALNSGTKPIRTYVVGFALPSFTVGTETKTCNDLTDADFTSPSGLCNNPSHYNLTALQACCSLNRIAINGSGGLIRRALFAQNKAELTSSISRILTEITPITSRTQPVTSGAAGGFEGFRFYSSVKPVSFQPWVGVLERQRYECLSEPVAGGGVRHYASAMEIKASEGDDFAANVNSGLDRVRTFYSVEGGIGGETVYSSRSMRPNIGSSDPDGVGTYKSEQYSGIDSAWVAATKPEAIEIAGKCTDIPADDAGCRDRHLKWLVGLPNGTSYSRCVTKNTSECYLFGDILHSTPTLVGPPRELLRDTSYTAFRASRKDRPLVLYTSTNDGFLHAFKVTGTASELAGSGDSAQVAKVAKKTNNELWAFVPPAVLPTLYTQYPFTHQVLLDGAPVVKDVVATVTGSGSGAQIALERSKADAQAGGGDWRSILVQSFGGTRGGYFAIDVTDPDQMQTSYTTSTTKGPRFMWQLTTDQAGTFKLFGKSGGTPLIATIFLDATGGPKEVAVAVLPGGGGTPVAGQCPTTARTFTGVDPEFPPRGKVRCYDASDIGSRSLTIVRLDTGEILRTFRQAATEIVLSDSSAQARLRARVTTAPLDSPITGQPVAFPAGVGVVSDRVFVGDQDGRLWKVNLASTNPANWTMSLFFDGYPATYGSDPNFPNAYDAGQPIQLPPVLSVDEVGDVTMNVATGDQDSLGAATGMKTFVWSLTEKTTSDRSPAASDANWFLPMTGGERVVGPMVLFNSALYFASYAPPGASSSVCNNGVSKVWGVHYTLGVPGPSGTVLVNQGGRAQLPGTSGLAQFLTASIATGDADATIFGVTVAQQPTCIGTATQTVTDSFTNGTHTTITDVTPGKVQLVMHTGSGGTQVPGGQSRTSAIDLAPPVSRARVDSWAALID